MRIFSIMQLLQNAEDELELPELPRRGCREE
jgi:hypothetical protein